MSAIYKVKHNITGLYATAGAGWSKRGKVWGSKNAIAGFVSSVRKYSEHLQKSLAEPEQPYGIRHENARKLLERYDIDNWTILEFPIDDERANKIDMRAYATDQSQRSKRNR